MKATLLRGADHVKLGAVEVAGEGAAAIALSRGGARKLYPHRDANEDAALLAEGRRGVLLAVADGHSGHEASAIVLEQLLERSARRWTETARFRPERWSEDALAALVHANQAILGEDWSNRPRPRTTLALALVRPDDGFLGVASIGDSHVFRACSLAVLDLAGPDEGEGLFFLGHGPETKHTLRGKARVQTIPLAESWAVVLATDGLSELGVGVPEPARAVEEALAISAPCSRERRASETARTVVEYALDAQRRHASGDNVAAAVVWLGEPATPVAARR